MVLGDRTGHPDDILFWRSLKAGARLKPDLILSVGDLIDGYHPDDRLNESAAQWDRVLDMMRRAFGDIRLFATAGNHDIWSEKSRALFSEKLGHGANFSLDVGAARVILFDTSLRTSETDIPDADLNWLVRELFQARAHRHRIVITHRPLWAVGTGGRYGSPLHDVLIAGSADWVITGHWHHAMAEDRDGIRYRMIGPSGTAPHRPGHPESGNFAQFGLLTIDPDDVALSIIPTSGILPSDTFTYEHNQLAWQIENRAITVENFNFDPTHPSRAGHFYLTVKNVAETPLNADISFDKRATGWRISPQTRPILLNPGKSTRLGFQFERPPGTPLFPGPILELPFQWPGVNVYRLATQVRPTMIRRVAARRRPPIIDGLMDESVWRSAAKLGPFVASNGSPVSDAIDVRLYWRDSSLYIGVEIPGSEVHPNVDGNPEQLFILLDPDPNDQTCHRIAMHRNGQVVEGTMGILDGVLSEPEMARVDRAATTFNRGTWHCEIGLDLGLGTERARPQRLYFNMGRERFSIDQHERIYWQPLRDHGLPSFGMLTSP